MAIELYEMTGADPRHSWSPYVWRTKMALAHKGLDYRSIGIQITEKEKIAFAGSSTVPVIKDGDKGIGDSWRIACYLEDTYPDRPTLFGGAIGRGQARFLNEWADRTLVLGLFPLLIGDIVPKLHEKDRDYFVASRTARLGATIEEVHARRDQSVEPFRKNSLQPLRALLKNQPYLCGDAPAYGDYIMFGPFQWARICSDFEVLESDDPIQAWRTRMLALFDGLAAKAFR